MQYKYRQSTSEWPQRLIGGRSRPLYNCGLAGVATLEVSSIYFQVDLR